MIIDDIMLSITDQVSCFTSCVCFRVEKFIALFIYLDFV